MASKMMLIKKSSDYRRRAFFRRLDAKRYEALTFWSVLRDSPIDRINNEFLRRRKARLGD